MCHTQMDAASPAPILPVTDGDERLQVRALQAVLQQLLGRVHVLGHALHALVQHPRALADLALGGGDSRSGCSVLEGRGTITEERSGMQN